MVIDIKEERNMILTQAVPEIQDFCSQLGLHFQLVDLNWAVEDGMLDSDLSLGGVHQREIAECQQLSLATNFVVSFMRLRTFFCIRTICVHLNFILVCFVCSL